MKTCDELQLALEMRRRGALGATESEEVQAHLAACERCRRADALAQATDAELQAMAAQAASKLDFDRIAREVRAEIALLRWLPWLLLGSFLAQGALLAWWLPGEGLKPFYAVGATGAVFAVLAAGYSWAKLRGARRAADLGGEELLAFRRKQLDAELASQRQLRWTGPAFAAACVLIAVLGWPGQANAGWVLLGLAAVFLILTANASWRVIPRLRRERAELS